MLVFFRSFLTLSACLRSFLLDNSTRLLFRRRQSSILSLTMLQFSLSNILQTESSKWLWWTEESIPIISTHALHDYWALSQHCLSICTSLSHKVVVILWEIANSDSSFAMLEVSFRTFATRLSVCSSCLSCLPFCYWIMTINSYLFNFLRKPRQFSSTLP